MEGKSDAMNENSKTFAEELHWCINQLELGLQRLSPDSRQAVESIKILKILKSQKAPMVKKRQVMRNTFGDYRKKMKEAEKKSLSGLRHSRFQPLGVMKRPMASRFLKMSYQKQQNVDHIRSDLDKNLSNLHLHSSILEPGTPASQNAAGQSCHASDLDSQASLGSVDSTQKCLTSSVSVQDDFQKGIQSSKQIDKISDVTSQINQYLDNELGYSNCGDVLQSCSSHVVKNSNSLSKFSLTEASSSSSSYHGGRMLRKEGNNFNYEPTDNSFTFNFEHSEKIITECCKNVVADDEMPNLGKLNLMKVSGKNAANVYKYDKSDNDFCFNFEEVSGEV